MASLAQPLQPLLTAGDLLRRVGSAARISPVVPGDSFAKQWSYIDFAGRFATVKCSRRAGKTYGHVLRTIKGCQTTPGYRVLYINLTATNADQQYFKRLCAELKRRNIDYRADNSMLMTYWRNGSFVRAMGCDNIGEVKTKLGDYWDEVIVDEMQSYADEVLHELIDRAAIPTLTDRRGRLICSGTPAVTKAGRWYKMYTRDNFAHFFWTLFDNTSPGFCNELDPILEAYAVRGIKQTDAIFRREMLGEDCTDPDAVVFKYESPRNDLLFPPSSSRWECDGFFETSVPEPDHPAWRHVMGVDLGFSDHDAIVVLGWRDDDPEHRLYERWTWQKNHLDYLALAAVFEKACERWQPQEICADTGGHGARKIVESLRSVFNVYKFAFKPASVLDSISLVNDEFRTGRLLVDPDGLVAHDALLVVWKPDKHEVEISDTFHSDVMAALRYAHSVAHHYESAAVPPEENDDERTDKASRLERFARQDEQRRLRERDPYGPYGGRRRAA